MRRRAKVDSNQAEIVARFRHHGATVLHVHQIPDGALDLVIGYGGIDVRIEIKPNSQAKLTSAEARTFQYWKGRPPVIITCVEDVDQLIANLQSG